MYFSADKNTGTQFVLLRSQKDRYLVNLNTYYDITSIFGMLQRIIGHIIIGAGS